MAVVRMLQRLCILAVEVSALAVAAVVSSSIYRSTRSRIILVEVEIVEVVIVEPAAEVMQVIVAVLVLVPYMYIFKL